MCASDSPYSESLFRRVKYCPAWPTNGSKSLNEARAWVEGFVSWYNKEHHHGKIRFVTPNQRKYRLDTQLLACRKSVLEKTKQCIPMRWSGSTKNYDTAGTVILNTYELQAVS
jgi:hypothetical protein